MASTSPPETRVAIPVSAGANRGTTLVLLCVVLCLVLVSGCATADGYWSFPLTRGIFSSGASFNVPSGKGAEALLVFVGCIVGIDLVLLPLTLAHDLWLLQWRCRSPYGPEMPPEDGEYWEEEQDWEDGRRE